MNRFNQSFRITIIAFLTTFLCAAFAQSQCNTEVMLLDVKTGEVTQLTHVPKGAYAANPAFTHNGKYVIYELTTEQKDDCTPLSTTLGMVDVKTEEFWNFCEFPGVQCDPLDDFANANDPRWSPNGNYLLFDGLNDFAFAPIPDLNLYVFTSEGKKVLSITNFPFVEDENEGSLFGSLFGDWSQDSKKVVFTALVIPGVKTLRTYNIETKEPSADLFTPIPILRDEPEDSRFNAAWSPNGQYIAYVYSDFEHDFDDPKFDPKASFLARNIYKIRVDHNGDPMGDPVSVTTDPMNPEDEGIIDNDHPSWSNDSKTIVFHSNRLTDDQDTVYDYNLWTVSANGGEPTLLLDRPDTYEATPAFSKNGRWIVFAGQPIEPTVEKAEKKSKRR